MVGPWSTVWVGDLEVVLGDDVDGQGGVGRDGARAGEEVDAPGVVAPDVLLDQRLCLRARDPRGDQPGEVDQVDGGHVPVGDVQHDAARRAHLRQGLGVGV